MLDSRRARFLVVSALLERGGGGPCFSRTRVLAVEEGRATLRVPNFRRTGAWRGPEAATGRGRRAPDEPTERAHMTAETKLEPSIVNVRIKISALWTSMLFVFAYVDLFSLYRADFRADLEAGEAGGFTINQSFLLGVV